MVIYLQQFAAYSSICPLSAWTFGTVTAQIENREK